MSVSCPTEDELLELALGDARERDVHRMGDHVTACATCFERLAAWRRLVGEVSAPRGDDDGEAFGNQVLTRVMAAETAEGRRRVTTRASRWRWGLPAFTAALALGGLLLALGPGSVLHGLRGAGPPDGVMGTFAARGGSAEKGEVLAEVSVLRARRRGPAAAGVLRDGDAMALKYGNPGARPVFLMALAFDAAGAVHWLYPAYLDPASDPAALLVAAHTADRIADEVVQPEHPARGTLRVVTLVFPSSHHVREIERRLVGASSKNSLRSLFPEAQFKEWTFECTGS